MSGGITLEEMKNITANIDLSSDIGNVIDIGGESSDDFASLLMNPKVTGGASASTSTGGPPAIELTPLEPLEPIKLDIPSMPAMAPIEIGLNPAPEPAPATSSFDNFQTSSASAPTFQMAPPRDLQAERIKKQELLNKLQRLESKGFPISKRFTQDNNLEEIESEYNRLIDARNLENSIRRQRNMLMGFVTGVEWLNNKFDPLDLELDGWSESVHENIEDYDEIFEDLYDKYKDRANWPPEMRLLLALGGSGFMFHFSNTMIRQKMPSMEKVFQANPDLARQMAAATAAQMGPGFGNFMGAVLGGQQQSQPQQFQQPQQQQPFYASTGAVPSAPSSQQPQVARKEMKGPSGVDDILKTFEEVRRADMEGFKAMNQPVPMMSVGGGVPDMTQSAVFAAASEFSFGQAEQDDSASQYTKGTSSGRSGGGRKKKQPVGNTVSLNV